jgi:hypothetical protein
MIAAPRFCTVGMKVPSIHAWSLMSLAAFWPATSAWKTSGYCVRRMVAPDRHLLHVRDGLAGLLRHLGERAVMVEPHHRGELRGLEARRVLHRDQRVGIGRVADHEDLHVARGDLVQRLALGHEDGAIGLQQVLALHAGAARARTHQQRHVHVLERGLRVRGAHHRLQQREGAVVELHHHALQRLLRLLVGDLEQLQDHRLVLAEHLAAGDPEQQAVADLAGGAGHGDAHGLLHLGLPGAVV